jgi:hypothetical protein
MGNDEFWSCIHRRRLHEDGTHEALVMQYSGPDEQVLKTAPIDGCLLLHSSTRYSAKSRNSSIITTAQFCAQRTEQPHAITP